MQLRGVGLVSVLLLGSLLRAAASASSASLVVGAATGVPGERVRVSVTLHTDDTDVIGIQNDLQLPGPGAFAVSVDGDGVSPDCELGPDLVAGEVGGSFLTGTCQSPSGCPQVRAQVIGQYAHIADGATLYTCSIDIAANAAAGSYPIACFGGAATSQGGIVEEIATTCIPGTLTVTGGPAPTPTPSAVAESTNTFTPTAVQLPGETPAIEIGRTSGSPGQTVEFVARLVGVGRAVIAGLQADITFDPRVAVRERNGHPDCTPGTSPNLAGFSAFAFLVGSCNQDSRCTGMRAVIAPVDLMAIPDGAVLFTCEIDIASDAAPGTYPLAISNIEGADLRGDPLLLGGRDGGLTVQRTSAGSVANNASMGGGCGVVTGERASLTWVLGIAAALLLVRLQRRTTQVRGMRPGEGRRRS